MTTAELLAQLRTRGAPLSIEAANRLEAAEAVLEVHTADDGFRSAYWDVYAPERITVEAAGV